MTEVVNLKEAFKLKRDIENYIEKWESANPEEDPLLRSWKKYIEEETKDKGKK